MKQPGIHVKGRNATEAFENAIVTLKVDPDFICSPRGQKIHECINAVVEVDDIHDNVVWTPDRKISLKYLVAELCWYLSGDQSRIGANAIAHYAKFWDYIRNPDGTLNSNYGHYIFNRMGSVVPYFTDSTPDYYEKNQFQYVVDKLKEDKDSRQAIININSIHHKRFPTKDFPCTTSIQFMIREDVLYMTVHMRSCDIVLGYCNDAFQFCHIQKLVWRELSEIYPGLECGSYTLMANSLHLYERHFDMADKISEADETETPNMECTDYYCPSLEEYESLLGFEAALRLHGSASNLVFSSALIQKYTTWLRG